MAFAVTPSPDAATASTTRSARTIEDPLAGSGATAPSVEYNGPDRTSPRNGPAMNDDELHRRIDDLVAEEHRLERAHVGRALSDDERERMGQLGVQLDRYWDLLRQRDARRRAGLDPDGAQERSGDVVEGYRQ